MDTNLFSRGAGAARLEVAGAAAGSVGSVPAPGMGTGTAAARGAEPVGRGAQPKSKGFLQLQGVSWKSGAASPVLDGASLQDSLSLAVIPPSQQQIQKIT